MNFTNYPNSLTTANKFFNSSAINSYKIPTSNNLISNSSFDIYHHSIPNVKLYYPEPFIASPTFMHDDIWFLHIVIYQYWLWFFFIFLIVFFFITFLVTLRWCNLRLRPARETRGVSRSKCGDLITATVPVSWATSIIIHESTDAIELADGFGTTELAIGIRAYQWGWEYYYPKDLNLHFTNANKSYFFGNSLKMFNQPNSNFKSFKNLALNKDTTSYSSLSNLLIMKSLNFNNANFFNNFINTGENKLISLYSSNLLMKPKLLQYQTALQTPNFNYAFTNFQLLKTYTKHYWQSSIQTKPFFNHDQFHLLNLYAKFNYFSNYTNLNNLTTTSYSFNQSCHNLYFQPNQNLVTKHNFSLFENEKLYNVSTPYKFDLFSQKKNMFMNLWTQLNKSVLVMPYLIADQDFKRWAMLDLYEDFLIDNFSNDAANTFFKSNPAFDLSTKSDTFTYSVENCKLKNLLWSDKTTTINFTTTLWPNLYININNNGLQNINFFKEYLINSWSNLQQIKFFSASTSSINFFFSNSHFFKTLFLNELLRNYAGEGTSSFFNINNEFEALYLNKNSIMLGSVNHIQWNKNLNIFSQAFAKIFKVYIDEERNAALFSNISSVSTSLPFISSTPSALLGTWTKNNKKSQFEITSYKPNLKTWSNIDSTSSLNSLLNYFSFSFPFPLSLESDIIRYTWFDWYTIRNIIITKSMDTSLFGLHGAKYYSFNFTKNKQLSLLNQVDNFFNKYTQARNLFVPASIHAPYFLSNYLSKQIQFSTNLEIMQHFTTISGFEQLSELSNWIDKSYFFLSPAIITILPKYSNSTSPFTPYYTHTNLQETQFLTTQTLVDVLAKREFLYLLLNRSKSNTLMLGDYELSYKNSIFTDFKNLFNTSLHNTTSSTNNDYFVKQSQYQAYKKGISNMIRIQADRAIAMPIETRLQILAVSKDIIHSWAIPSAGVKIDCIPGYSSHRVIIFLVSGIYWGQCMEICGRFHHWMPIVVYFMKRDLFSLWCIHFVFKNKQMNNLNQSSYLLSKNFSPLINNSWQSWVYEY